MLEEKIKLTVLRLHKWDLIREHRVEQYEGAYKIRSFSEKMQYIVKLAKTREILIKLFHVFDRFRFKKQKLFRMALMSFKMARSLKKCILKRGPTLDYRMRLSIRNVMTL